MKNSFDVISWKRAMLLGGFRRGNGRFNPSQMYQGFSTLTRQGSTGEKNSISRLKKIEKEIELMLCEDFSWQKEECQSCVSNYLTEQKEGRENVS